MPVASRLRSASLLPVLLSLFPPCFRQIGDGALEHAYWGPAESDKTPRPSFDVTPEVVGSEPTAEAAAAMAAGSLVFKDQGTIFY